MEFIKFKNVTTTLPAELLEKSSSDNAKCLAKFWSLVKMFTQCEP